MFFGENQHGHLRKGCIFSPVLGLFIKVFFLAPTEFRSGWGPGLTDLRASVTGASLQGWKATRTPSPRRGGRAITHPTSFRVTARREQVLLHLGEKVNWEAKESGRWDIAWRVDTESSFLHTPKPADIILGFGLEDPKWSAV